ncbi:hypothetical protein FGRMN_5034 [Fusarium graminum]|nr:hypothetical protein FGRMN_5034 [Fusarium graminum]
MIILGLCIWASIRMAMARGKIYRLVMALIVGLFVVAATITRLVYLVTNDAYTVDLTYKMVRTALWFPLEIHIGLWCSCLPTYQPLFELNSSRPYDRYSMSKFSRSSGWDPQEDVWQRDYMTTNPQVSISGQPRDPKGKRKASDAESTDGIVMLDNERGIHLTTEFSVHVEDRVDSAEGSQDRVYKTPAWNAF